MPLTGTQKHQLRVVFLATLPSDVSLALFVFVGYHTEVFNR